MNPSVVVGCRSDATERPPAVMTACAWRLEDILSMAAHFKPGLNEPVDSMQFSNAMLAGFNHYERAGQFRLAVRLKDDFQLLVGGLHSGRSDAEIDDTFAQALHEDQTAKIFVAGNTRFSEMNVGANLDLIFHGCPAVACAISVLNTITAQAYTRPRGSGKHGVEGRGKH